MTTQSLLTIHKNKKMSRGKLEKPPRSDSHLVNGGHGQTGLPPDLPSFGGEGSGNLLVGKKGDFSGVLSQKVESQKTGSYVQGKAKTYNGQKQQDSPGLQKSKNDLRPQKTGINCQNIGNFQKQEKNSQKTTKKNQTEGLAYQKGACEDVARYDNKDSACGKKCLVGDDEKGNKYLKALYCGRDWCSIDDCVRITHKRRVARWLRYALLMEKAGLFTFTIPEEMREVFKNQEKLSELRTYLRRKLKRIYPELKALTGWHWFGDKNLTKYHPHLHVLVACLQFLPKKDIDQLRVDYKEALERISGIKIGDKQVNLHYHYQDCESKIFHAIRYITRPTFLVYDEELAFKLKGFMNRSVWGKWRDLTIGEKETLTMERELNSKLGADLVDLVSNTSPESKTKITWRRGLYPGRVAQWAKKDYGCGFYNVSNLNEETLQFGILVAKTPTDESPDMVDEDDLHGLRLIYLGY